MSWDKWNQYSRHNLLSSNTISYGFIDILFRNMCRIMSLLVRNFSTLFLILRTISLPHIVKKSDQQIFSELFNKKFIDIEL